jgi:hypothetical protein
MKGPAGGRSLQSTILGCGGVVVKPLGRVEPGERGTGAAAHYGIRTRLSPLVHDLAIGYMAQKEPIRRLAVTYPLLLLFLRRVKSPTVEARVAFRGVGKLNEPMRPPARLIGANFASSKM